MPTLNTTAHVATPGGSITRVPITALAPDGDRTTLMAGRGSPTVKVTIPSRPDVDRARQWLGSVRRIAGVEIAVGARPTTARAWGCRHRLPFTSAIPVAVALGLTELGVPTTVVRGAA